ncbi:hypothetical protein CcCBS67573_g01556 [Chytriomyces confervae]|uniref:GH26 domain-containing protein n=1 Tax=Chytriomyces confervae TaxID=246404 RepID=A0A507FNC6_9FUNG|nr:hypothetical protein CcCBS67573_g01556 [Chytriomyces confervae]
MLLSILLAVASCTLALSPRQASTNGTTTTTTAATGTAPCVFSSDCKFTLGAWFWHTDMTPSQWNQVMGRQYPSFQTDYSVPFDNSSMLYTAPGARSPIPITLRDVQGEWTEGTQASAFITAYADQETSQGRGLDLITDEWLRYFANHLKKINTDTGRKCPEMEGTWMIYGPPVPMSTYVAVWIRMYRIVKQVYPDIQIVWAPNYGWPNDIPGGSAGYWPGPEYVDVIGSSLYWKGFGRNTQVDKSFITTVMNGQYEYATRYNKPFVITEASGAWELDVPSATDQVTIQRQFWGEILSTEFLDAYPLIQAAYIFDFAKPEEFFRDFKVSNNTSVRNMFIGLVDALDAKGRMAWAATATSSSTTTTSAVATNTATATANAASVVAVSTTSKSGAYGFSFVGAVVVGAVFAAAAL